MNDDDRIRVLTAEVASLRIRVATLERLLIERASTVPPSAPEPEGAGYAPPQMMRVRAPRSR